MNTVNTCLFALRFVLLSYRTAPKVELTPAVQDSLRHMRSAERRLHRCQEVDQGLPENLHLEERLVIRGCLRGLAEAIDRTAELNGDMCCYHLGVSPAHPDIQAALQAVITPAVAA